MSQYFYHLSFELYPSPDTYTSFTNASNPGPKYKQNKQQDTEGLTEIWLPSVNSDIFDSSAWPSHSRRAPVLAGWNIPKEPPLGSESVSSPPRNLNGSAVIDCGPRRAPSRADGEDLLQAVTSTTEVDFPPPSPRHIRSSLEVAKKDWRFGPVQIESWNALGGAQRRQDSPEEEGRGREGTMDRPGHKRGQSSAGIGSLGEGTTEPSRGLTAGRVTKARFEEGKNTEVGWGIVHLYRDGEESQGLGSGVEVYTSSVRGLEAREGRAQDGIETAPEEGSADEDFTTLCIPAVPSYLTPSDFLGFVGEKTREEVSHFRMVMTARMNRYLVLMKFRDGRRAKTWKAEWDGKVFNTMEPETCHVAFIKSITFQTPSTSASSQPNTSFPALAHDPFTPSSTHLKPFPPPTASLIELPTCPVCLERMDDTTGLLTILCQHVFHCSCLQKWRGSGCPVCRHTNASSALYSSSSYSPDPPFGSGEASLCSVCDSPDDLWICLICGRVGCGRYKGGHAKEHWKETAHCFALEIETQHVWDYAGDMWVHRLIRDKGNGKVVELPSSSSRDEAGVKMDMVPREKLERIGIEYTHLLTSQLESQRVYFEELVGKAVGKAEHATSSAAQATTRADDALARLRIVEAENARLRGEIVVGLEKDLARERKKAEKSSEVARGFGKSLMDEKKVSEGLMSRIEHVNEAMMKMSGELGSMREENEELKEQNRDLLFSLSAGEKIRELEGQEGGLEAGELEGGTVVVPDTKKGRRKK